MTMDADEVAAQCSQDWQQIKNIQAKLQSSTPKTLSNDEPLLHALQETEKRLKGELESIQEKELSTMIPQNKEIQRLVLKQEEQRVLEEYAETLAFLRAKRADTVEALKKSESEFSQLNQVNAELKRKVMAVRQAEQDKTSNNSLDAVLLEMQEKVDKISEADRFFKKSLKNMLIARCPTPEPAQVRLTLNESQDVDPSRVMGIKGMLGKLIEQSLNSPEQPYVELDARAWPAQVEFLIRSQLVVQHPSDPQRIKLVPFNL